MWYELGASPTAMTRRFQAVADSLAIGCLLAGCYNFLGARKWYTALLKSRLFLLLPLTIMLLAGGTALHSRGLFYVLGQSIGNIVIVLCVDRYVRYPGTVGGRLLNCRLLVFVGVLSYSLYLWQQLFLNPMNEVPYYTGFPQNVLFAIGAALLSYYAVERPFLMLKSRSKKEPAPPAGRDSSVEIGERDTGNRISDALSNHAPSKLLPSGSAASAMKSLSEPSPGLS